MASECSILILTCAFLPIFGILRVMTYFTGRSGCTEGLTNMLLMSFCSLCLLWLQPGCVAISRGPGWCCSEIMMLQPPFQTGSKRRELRVLRKGPVYSRFRSNEQHDAVYFSAPGGTPRRSKSLQRVTQPVLKWSNAIPWFEFQALRRFSPFPMWSLVSGEFGLFFREEHTQEEEKRDPGPNKCHLLLIRAQMECDHSAHSHPSQKEDFL